MRAIDAYWHSYSGVGTIVWKHPYFSAHGCGFVWNVMWNTQMHRLGCVEYKFAIAKQNVV